MIKIFIQSPQYLPEFFIIINYLPDGMKQISALVIHIATAFLAYSVRPNDRSIIRYFFPQALHIFISSLLAIIIFREKGFRIISKTLMNPHVSNVFCSKIVAKPFVSTFMNNDIIPFFAPAGFGKVHAQITIPEFISIGNG